MKLEQVPTPAYVIDLAKLEENCSILQEVQEKAGCKVLLAQKAYSLYKTYPLIVSIFQVRQLVDSMKRNWLEKNSQGKSMYLHLLSRNQIWKSYCKYRII